MGELHLSVNRSLREAFLALRIRCPWDCGTVYHLGTHHDHSKSCINAVHACRNAKYLCPFRGNNTAVLEHEQECAINALIPLLKRYDSQISTLIADHKKLATKVLALEQQLALRPATFTPADAAPAAVVAPTDEILTPSPHIAVAVQLMNTLDNTDSTRETNGHTYSVERSNVYFMRDSARFNSFTFGNDDKIITRVNDNGYASIRGSTIVEGIVLLVFRVHNLPISHDLCLGILSMDAGSTAEGFTAWQNEAGYILSSRDGKAWNAHHVVRYVHNAVTNGEVIGMLVDLENNIIHYIRHGVDQGPACNLTRDYNDFTVCVDTRYAGESVEMLSSIQILPQ